MSSETAPEGVMADVPVQSPQENARAQKWAETKTDFKWAAALLLVFLLGVFGYRYTAWQSVTGTEEDLPRVTGLIFGELVVPFEVLSVLLLAALVGGIAIGARDPVTRKTPDEAPVNTLEEREI